MVLGQIFGRKCFGGSSLNFQKLKKIIFKKIFLGKNKYLGKKVCLVKQAINRKNKFH